MAVDERRRQQMYRKLEEILGPDEAVTLMEYLPSAGWDDVARKSDLERVLGEMGRLEDRLTAKLESKLNSQTKALVGLMTGQVVAVAGLAFAAARLA
jgi:hypothetical protein